jgi:hypothetical protein
MFGRQWFLTLVLAGAASWAVPVHAQQAGSKLPKVVLEGLTQTGAKSFEDFTGRAVLIEFFAYW